MKPCPSRFTARRTLTSLSYALLALLSVGAHAEVIHVSADGDDAHDGSASSPIRTLAMAQKIIERSTPADTEVLISPGIYAAQTVVWSYTMPKHTIRFVGSPGSIFDGGGKGLTFFELRGAKGAPTNLVFEGLTVTHYATAISLDGNRNVSAEFNGRNRIIGNRFVDVGGNDPKGNDSTAVIRFVNSDDNMIEDNLFKGMVSKNCQLLHALYFAHGSSGNRVERNTFEDGCGDPIRFRDASNKNVVRNNTFTKVGKTSAVSEWFCAGSTACTKKTSECPSHDNVIENNTFGSNYAGMQLKSRDVIKRAAPPDC